MKNIFLTTIIVGFSISCMAVTTIDPSHSFAYGANVGWINARGDVANGAEIGAAFCNGYLYSANCGWIGLGDGAPDNGWQYSNTSSTDWGINHDGAGNLSGYAYGANIGWINFEQSQGQPKIDLTNGNLSGYAYGANVGWISLSNSQAFVRSTTISAGSDTDSDGIPDAWEYRQAGDLTTLSGAGHDADGDGASDVQEYGADTYPENAGSVLRLTLNEAGVTTNQLSWPTLPTRLYRLQSTTNLTNEWVNADSGVLYDESGTLAIADEPITNSPARFYRVNAILPLSE